MDHPALITHLAVLDSVPIGEALRQADATFEVARWHWFFYAQPDLPERAILADPDAWYRTGLHRAGQRAPATTQSSTPRCATLTS